MRRALVRWAAKGSSRAAGASPAAASMGTDPAATAVTKIAEKISPRTRKGPALGANFPQLEPLEPGNYSTVDDEPTSMLLHIVDVMQKHPDCVVLTQVGSFYELYLEQAVEWGPKLNLRVARKRQQSPIAHLPFVNMAGFPVQHRDRYVRELVQTYGKSVVILEQVPNEVRNASAERAKRPVARIVTPGTLLAESFVDATTNNYLLAVSFAPQTEDDVVLAWVDVGVGSLVYQTTDRASLPSDIARIAPAEVLVDSTWRANEALVQDMLQVDSPIVFHNFPPARDALAYYGNRFDANGSSTPSVATQYALDALPDRVQKAVGALLSYVDNTLPGSAIRFELPAEWRSGEMMQLDPRARDALEMLQRGSVASARGSLLSVLRRTVTPAGTRLLHQWLVGPLQKLADICWRHDRVELFVRQMPLELRHMVRELPDGRRLLQKLALRKLDPLELYTWAQSVSTLQSILQIIPEAEPLMSEWRSTLADNLPQVQALADRILKSIDITKIIAMEQGSNTVSGSEAARTTDAEEGADASLGSGYIPVLKPYLSKRLKELHDIRATYSSRRKIILEKLGARHGLGNVSLKWSPLYHYHVHLKLSSTAPLPDEDVIVRHKKTAAIRDNEWSSLGVEHDQVSDDIQREERRILERLNNKVISHVATLRKCYGVADELDVLMGLADLARERGLVRPQMVKEPILDIRGGRHITVESGLEISGSGQIFSANDTELTERKPVCMVTGPNMGGKSTYIRQCAVIALLAHIGSFVPAQSARIGIVDRIFCRIGAGDDLYRGRSTFMMEMLESAQILASASAHSLAILDEVGRGTATQDGLAIAAASIKHLALRTGCRSLFATHFGKEIWDTLTRFGEGASEAVQCVQTSVNICDGEIHFDYVLKPGVASNSHGLLVAKLAGFPENALADARKILDSL